jgi:acetolactate synthase-1/2/3 large subunit
MNKARKQLVVPRGTVADTYLALLANRGVEYLFGNAGTDFPSIIEGLAKAHAAGTPCPTPITVPHENAAVGMAYGYYLATGRPQAVMVHVGVGTANAAAMVVNASRENIPVLMTAGRTPIAEKGLPGARSRSIHWAQESFDQAAMLREYTKWDYELRGESDVETIIDRALQVACTDPMGPVYLTLPREVLAREEPDRVLNDGTRLPPAAPPVPNPGAVDEAAALLLAAKRPLIVAGTVGRTAEGVAALASLVGRFALPVVQSLLPRYMNLPADHEMHMGYDIERFVGAADAILVVDSDVPWTPDEQAPPDDCRIIHLGADAIYERYPVRGFAGDVVLKGDTALGLGQLEEAMRAAQGDTGPDADALQGRRERLAAERAEIAEKWGRMAASETSPEGGVNPFWATRLIYRLCGPEATYVNEYPFFGPNLPATRPGSQFSVPPAGGLGWGLGTALGMKLAEPGRLVVAGIGDGSYFFNNPSVAHFVGQANDLPLLVAVFNNRGWNAVRMATLALYPDGEAARLNETMPLTHLTPSPAFEKMVEASGGLGLRVEKPDELEPAMLRAIDAVTNERRQTVINILT